MKFTFEDIQEALELSKTWIVGFQDNRRGQEMYQLALQIHLLFLNGYTPEMVYNLITRQEAPPTPNLTIN